MKERLFKLLSFSGLLSMLAMLCLLSSTAPASASTEQHESITATATQQPTPLITTTPITVGDDFPIYKAQFVEDSDSLNVRSGPGVQYPIVGIVANGDELQALGVTKLVSDSRWLPVRALYRDPEFTGWINRQYAVPQVKSSIFCADANALAIVNETIEAVRTQDGKRLAKLITPVRGLYIWGEHWGKELQLSENQVGSFFTDPTYMIGRMVTVWPSKVRYPM